MRVDVAFILTSMGFVPDTDFVAIQDTPTNVNVIWRSQTTMPTVAEIDVAAPSAAANIATKAAQVAKAAATASIDNGQLISGASLERLVRALALITMDEINILRAAVKHPIVSITRVGAVATATTLDPHGLNSGDTARIMGATLAPYNVAAVATVTSATVFTYPVAGSPATPAVGSMFFAMGAIPATKPRTSAQIVTAIKAKIALTAE